MNVLVLQMFLISAEVSGNITEAVRNHTGKEPERMNRLRKIFKNMKYRHKLTIFLVVTSLVPMTVLAWYSHSRLSTMVRSSELEDMQSIMEQTRESIDSQTAVYASLLNYLTYSPDIEEIIKEKNIDNYTAYEKYTEIAKVMGLDVDGLGPEVVKENLLNRLKVLRKKLGINDYAIVEELDDKLLDKLAEGALLDPCIVTNPRMLSLKEVTTVYGQILRKKR